MINMYTKVEPISKYIASNENQYFHDWEKKLQIRKDGMKLGMLYWNCRTHNLKKKSDDKNPFSSPPQKKQPQSKNNLPK